VEWHWQGETKVLGEKQVSVSLCSPQIPHRLTWARTRPSAVWVRRLTAVLHGVHTHTHTHAHCRPPPMWRRILLGGTDRPTTHAHTDQLWTERHGQTAINIHSMAVTRTVQIWQRGETWGNTAVWSRVGQQKEKIKLVGETTYVERGPNRVVHTTCYRSLFTTCRKIWWMADNELGGTWKGAPRPNWRHRCCVSQVSGTPRQSVSGSRA